MININMTRRSAALSHFLLSLLIFSVVVMLMIYFWYPMPHFNASGGWQGIRIVAGVDLVLGPLLTFIVFNLKKSKKALFGDLTLIVLLQMAALIWGVNTIYHQRPLAVVFFETSFYAVAAVEFDKQGISAQELSQFGDQNPVLVYAELPTTREAIKSMQSITNKSQVTPMYQLGLYRPITALFDVMKSRPNLQINIDVTMDEYPKIKQKLMKIVGKENKAIDDYLYFQLYSSSHAIVLMFDQGGKYVDYLDARY